MTILEFICILCSAGGVIAVLALIALIVLIVALAGAGRPSTRVNILLGLTILVVFGGFGGCAAEDRVCEIADRGGQ